MSDRASHKSRHRKHSESHKVLRTITFVLTPFLVFIVVCGVFVLALFKPYSSVKPYLETVFNPESVKNKDDYQTSIYHPDNMPVRVKVIEDEETKEKHTMIYPYYGDYYGTLTISSVGIDKTPIYCGTSNDLLAKGVGWSNSSVYIGRVGNVVLAGHRNTYFATLFNCKPGDIVVLDTDCCTVTYIVKETAVFHKSNLKYVNPTFGTDKLTMYTCWGYNNMLGATDQRFAVVCDLVERKWKDVKIPE